MADDILNHNSRISEANLINVGQGHTLYVETTGAPSAPAVLVLHGGPGAGFSPMDHTLFPEDHRTIAFDQRGSRRSTPRGSITANDLDHLIKDIELLRKHFNVERWVVFGRSWGAYLALRYGSLYPDRCKALLLWGLFLPTTSKSTFDLSQPRDGREQEWRNCILLPGVESGGIKALEQLILGNDQTLATKAACALTGYLDALAKPANSRVERHRPTPTPAETLAYARVLMHYHQHGFFNVEQALEPLVAPLSKVPSQLVHSVLDQICPIENAYTLQAAWPAVKLSPVLSTSHSAFEPLNLRELKRAGNSLFKSLKSRYTAL